MTKKEIHKMVEALPDSIVEKAYAMDPLLGSVQICFDAGLIKRHLAGFESEVKDNGFVVFNCTFGDVKWRVVLT